MIDLCQLTEGAVFIGKDGTKFGLVKKDRINRYIGYVYHFNIIHGNPSLGAWTIEMPSARVLKFLNDAECEPVCSNK